MAEFHLWSKDNLVKFAEEATVVLIQKDARIVQLEKDLKVVKEAWRQAVSSDTVHEWTASPPHSTQPVSSPSRSS
jgi:hypothetical protein